MEPLKQRVVTNLSIRFNLQWRIQDFPEEGVPTAQGGRQHTILPNFSKNCMKLEEFRPPGRASLEPPPLRSATDLDCLLGYISFVNILIMQNFLTFAL